jgi:hypothetical protein
MPRPIDSTLKALLKNFGRLRIRSRRFEQDDREGREEEEFLQPFPIFPAFLFNDVVQPYSQRFLLDGFSTV